MDRIAIPARDVAPLEQFAKTVFGLRLAMVNVFAIVAEDGAWVLIDAGLPYTANSIRDWAGRHFGENVAPEAIILTHGHFDHAGSAEDLADHWDVPVYAHTLELPYITGHSEYPAPDPTAGGGLMALLSPLYPRRPSSVGRRATPLPDDGFVPAQPEWKWIHTPGHTEGHVSLFRESDRTLIVGDAFCTTKAESLIAIATMRPELHGPPAYYTSDWAEAKRSIQKIAELDSRTVAPGHGLPLAGPDVPRRVRELAINFERVAVPDK